MVVAVVVVVVVVVVYVVEAMAEHVYSPHVIRLKMRVCMSDFYRF